MQDMPGQSELIAEETHAGRVWALLILPAIVGPVISVVYIPTLPAKLAMLLVVVVGGGALAMVLSGFQYRFLRHGVEVRTLGYRLRAIPRQAILSYSVEPWAFIRGYGIRGIGGSRAYVWCNRVVHIHTTTGEVYLGHADPERIVRNLDQVMGIVSRG